MTTNFQNEQEAFCLANTYGFNPPRKKRGGNIRASDPGKYEPDHTPAAATRCMTLASFLDKTNIIIQYEPDELDI